MEFLINKTFEPEEEEGNIEYKRYISNISKKRFSQLLSQMKWRLSEGEGKAIYYIGVNDDGSFYKLTDEKRETSISNITRLSELANAEIVINQTSNYLECFIEEKSNKVRDEECRILLLGDHGSGKSSLLGYLCYNLPDNGKGSLRQKVANHKHELEKGFTSSLTVKGFNNKEKRYIWIDTPGLNRRKYTKTRLFAIESYQPNLVIFVKKNKKLWEKELFYKNYLNILDIPFIELNTNMVGSMPNINLKDPHKENKIYNYLNSKYKKTKVNKKTIFYVNKVFPSVDLGYILSGFLRSGLLELNKKYYINYNNQIHPIHLKSIHILGNSIQKIEGPTSVSVCINENIFKESKPKGNIITNIFENLIPNNLEIEYQGKCCKKKGKYYCGNQIGDVEYFNNKIKIKNNILLEDHILISLYKNDKSIEYIYYDKIKDEYKVV